MQIALKYMGVPYVWGGASPSGFDCSGLVMYVYGQLGVSLPHLPPLNTTTAPTSPGINSNPVISSSTEVRSTTWASMWATGT